MVPLSRLRNFSKRAIVKRDFSKKTIVRRNLSKKTIIVGNFSMRTIVKRDSSKNTVMRTYIMVMSQCHLVSTATIHGMGVKMG